MPHRDAAEPYAEAEQSTALFACRAAAARELAASACERLEGAPAPSRFERARLAVSQIAQGFPGAGVAVRHNGTAASSPLVTPLALAIAAEAHAVVDVEDATQTGAPPLHTRMHAYRTRTEPSVGLLASGALVTSAHRM